VIHRAADRLLDRRGAGGVDGDGQGVRQPVRDPARAVLVDVREYNLGALAGEALGRRRAQAGGAAGHEGDLAVEPHLFRHVTLQRQVTRL